MVRINKKPKNTIIIQGYVPKTSHEDEDVKKLYDMYEAYQEC